MASMRRYGFSAIIAAGALWLGVVSLSRGQFWLGICFIGIALLRLGTIMWRRRARKPQPSIRLNIENDTASSEGSEEHRS
jgi:hypothetical protein